MKRLFPFLPSFSLSNLITFRYFSVIAGFLAVTFALYIMADLLQIHKIWVVIIMVLLLMMWCGYRWWRHHQAKKANHALSAELVQQADRAVNRVEPGKRDEVEALRARLQDAVKTIKTSKLGQLSGNAALYELPWYMVIGNPSAGKSSAVLNSGLQFPFADKEGASVQGVGGTRNCHWFFTTEGILLDTAGRYSVNEEDRSEWFGFLALLKKYRPKAPINGIVVMVSIADLMNNPPNFAITLAKQLRERVQELTEKLEVFAPVYVMFTKADLLNGFTEFFGANDKHERDRVWGATFPYQPGETSDVALFDHHFDELHEGLKELSLAQISRHRGTTLLPELLTFPLEFASIKPTLRLFLSTLFDGNPYQFNPIFRGFYLTSALQEGESTSTSSARIAQRFGLTNKTAAPSNEVFSKNGFFLRDLFSKVIFADKQLVRQYASPVKTRLRYATFLVVVTALGLLLGGWGWSYIGNRQLTENVQADLDKVVKLQNNRIDLQARLESMEVLQDRIEQLEQFKRDKPLSLSLGLYQGDALEHKLLVEYYHGLKQVLLVPVTGAIESYLTEVNAHPEQLQPMSRLPESGSVRVAAAQNLTTDLAADSAAVAGAPTGTTITPAVANGLYKDASVANVEDAYNALKTYLMLSDGSNKEHVDPSHLNDQITRFWRGWLETNRGTLPREKMIASAERLISFYLSRVSDDEWPTINNNLSLVDQSRENLRRMVRGLPARERIYAEIKARAATRYAPMTVARIVGDKNAGTMAGSHAVPGTFTKEAWQQYVEPAIKDAANKELQTTDWVLKVASRDDLTLEGSPEQIQKALVMMYKEEYASEWSKFLQGVTVNPFPSFDGAVAAMNKIGDPQNSIVAKLINTVYEQTSWDNPTLSNVSIEQAKTGVMAWINNLLSSKAPAINNVDAGAKLSDASTGAMGAVGREFVGVARLVVTRDNTSLLKGYVDSLSKLRTRFNVIKNQGDPGPGAKQLMQQTLDGSGSELADSLKFVDEQMLTGLSDTQRQALRPLLVRPLMQSYAVIITPTESELNKVWHAQVYSPFQQILAVKYPFSASSKVEANAAEIGQVFGPDGAVAKFVSTTMGPLTVRRGDLLTARTWADMGISLQPDFTANFTRWVAPLTGASAATSGAGGVAANQTLFQIQPMPVAGVTEYTVEIDGQQLRYRNSLPQWTNFVWPNPQGAPGAKVTATTFDGRSIDVVNEPGNFGLEKLISTAQRKKSPDGGFELSWSQGGVTVTMKLRIISGGGGGGQPTAEGGASGSQGSGLSGVKLPASIVGVAPVVNVTEAATKAATYAPVSSAATPSAATTSAASVAGAK